jgi:hypothetical protein
LRKIYSPAQDRFIYFSTRLIKVRTASHQVVLDANGAEAAIGEQEKRALALLTYGVNTSRFRHKFLKVVAY